MGERVIGSGSIVHSAMVYPWVTCPFCGQRDVEPVNHSLSSKGTFSATCAEGHRIDIVYDKTEGYVGWR
jgi:hypothetical protein